MSILDASYIAFGVISIAALLLTVFCLMNMIKSALMRRRSLLTAGSALIFAVIAVLFCGLDTIALHRNARQYAAVANVFSRIPLSVLLAVMCLILLAAVTDFILMKKTERSSLTPSSVREGLDGLPDGICYGKLNGIPLLVNKKMQALSVQAFGEGVFDTESLRRRFRYGDVGEGCAVEQKGDNRFLLLPDGTVWNIVENTLMLKKKPIRELIAYDVTERYRIGQELERRNLHLAEVNRELRKYNENMDAIIREREILDAKMRLHNDVGRSLLALRSYLSGRGGSREELVTLWQQTISILRGNRPEDDSESRIDALKKAADSVEVRLDIRGELPTEEKTQELVARAIHECLTNTVKHADGSELTVNISPTADGYRMVITNDGKQPKAPVTEKGGLKNLRRSIEMNGATMTVESAPRFKLTVYLPKEKAYE